MTLGATELPPLPGHDSSFAIDINDQDVAVGQSVDLAGGDEYSAVSWQDGTPTLLADPLPLPVAPTLTYQSTTITDISDDADVNLPATINAGDLLVIFAGYRYRDESGFPTRTHPVDWGLPFSNEVDYDTGVYYRIADGTEDGGVIPWKVEASPGPPTGVRPIAVVRYTSNINLRNAGFQIATDAGFSDTITSAGGQAITGAATSNVGGATASAYATDAIIPPGGQVSILCGSFSFGGDHTRNSFSLINERSFHSAAAAAVSVGDVLSRTTINSTAPSVTWASNNVTMTALYVLTYTKTLGISIAKAINNDGLTVGYGTFGGFFNGFGRGVTWNGTVGTLTPPLDGYYGTVLEDVNSDGVACGYGLALLPDDDAVGASSHALLWNSSSWTVLDNPSDTHDVSAISINDAGLVVGNASSSLISVDYGVLWNGGTPTLLAQYGSDARPTVYAITGDYIVGYSQFDNQSVAVPVVWSASSPSTPPTSFEQLDPSKDAYIYNVNTSGVCVGAAYDSNDFYLPVMWDTDGTIHLLPVLNAGDDNGDADGINAAGLMVGFSENGQTSAPPLGILWSVTDPGAMPASGTALFASFENINWY